MKQKWYIGLLSAIALLVAGVAALAQQTGQIIITTLGGTELFAVQTSGPQSTAISANNLSAWIGGAGRSATTGLFPTTLQMTDMRTAAGLMNTASASGTNFGLTYTPGTTAVLVGTATSSSTTGDTAAIDFVLPPNYIAGTNITVSVGCYYTNGSSTASTHTMAAAAYLNTNAGLQGTTLIATAAQTCPLTTSALQTFTITGTTLVPGSYLSLTFTAAVINGGGISTEWLTSVLLN